MRMKLKMGAKKLVSLMMIAVLSACCLLLPGAGRVPVLADELTDLQEQQDSLQEEKATVQAELDALATQQMSALEQKVLLDQQMDLTVSEIALVNDQITAYGVLIEEKEAELILRQEEEAAQFSAFCSRLRAMEESGEITYLQIIFGASDFSDLLSRIDCVSEIMQCDRNLYQDLTDARLAVEEAEAALQQGRTELEAKQEELDALSAELSIRIEEASALIIAIESDISEYQQYEAEIAGLEAAVQAEIDAIVAELERIREESAAAQNPPAPAEPETPEEPEVPEESEETEETEEPEEPEDTPVSIEGGFIWPTGTTLVTSAFGNRLHPIWNEWRMHTGIDIGAGYGESIWAAKSGQVIAAEEDEGYGNYVVLYHDDGSTTLYAHMSEILCSYGQQVSQGETIGLVGTSGWSDGPHLHFEIRADGICMDPLLYLP